MDRIGIIGAGAWGTALATVAHRAGRDVRIWAREADVVTAINTVHENTPFLPGVPLAPQIRATVDLGEAAEVDALILVTPAQFLRATCEALAPHLDLSVPLVICAKGVEIASGALMNEVVEQALPERLFAVLSGPTFAMEVAREQPTAVTLACADSKIGYSLAQALGTPRFRIYQSADVIGAEVGGARARRPDAAAARAAPALRAAGELEGEGAARDGRRRRGVGRGRSCIVS